jgi:hypothetical protein
LQANVASLPNAVDGRYVTLVSSPETTLHNVAALTDPPQELIPGEAAIYPLYHSFVAGLFSLEMGGADGDTPVDVEWILHGNTETTSLFHFTHDVVEDGSNFYSYRRDLDANTGIQSIAGGKIVSRYVDGAKPDLDQQSDGTIQLIAGPVLADGIPAQNPVQQWDVNNSGQSTLLDALIVINFLARQLENGVSLPFPADSSTFLDVNGDANVSPLDALLVLNFIARQQESGSIPQGEHVQPGRRPVLMESPSPTRLLHPEPRLIDEIEFAEWDAIGNSEDEHAVDWPINTFPLANDDQTEAARQRDIFEHSVDQLLSNDSTLSEWLLELDRIEVHRMETQGKWLAT